MGAFGEDFITRESIINEAVLSITQQDSILSQQENTHSKENTMSVAYLFQIPKTPLDALYEKNM